MSRIRRSLTETAIVLAVVLVYFGHVFQMPSDTLLKSGMSDWVDPYFINFLLEHWHQSLRHWSDPSSPLMFFPETKALGYSHGLILYVPFYSTARMFLEPFPAYNIALFLVLVVGSVCLYLIIRQGFGASFIEALLLTIFFCSSRNVVNGEMGVWSQRASVFLLPPIFLLGLLSARMRASPWRVCLAGLCGLLVSLLFTQDFYTGQLALLVFLLVAIGGVLLSIQPLHGAAMKLWQGAGATQPSLWWLVVAALGLAVSVIVLFHPVPRMTILIAVVAGGWFAFRLRRVLLPFMSKQQRALILSAAAGAGVGGLVFLWIYLGAYLAHPTFPEEQLTDSLRLVRVDGSALDWAAALHGYDSLRSFTLVLLLGAAAWVPFFRVTRKIQLYALWLMLVSVVVLLIPLRFNDFSVWKALFAPFPGLSVIRDPKRIVPLFELGTLLLIAFALTRVPRRSPFRLVAVALLLGLLATDWNPERLSFGRDTGVYNRWVRAPIAIDPACRSFFIKKASDQYMSRSAHMWMLYSGDAMFVAVNHSIPTLNGYSAWTPNGWELANPQEESYPQRVANWISMHGLQHVCEFDIEQRTMRLWTAVPSAEAGAR